MGPHDRPEREGCSERHPRSSARHESAQGRLHHQRQLHCRPQNIPGTRSLLRHQVCRSRYQRKLREEVAADNVRVMTIAPGAVQTELLSHTTSQDIIDGYEQWKKEMGGVLDPQNVADTVMFVYQQPQNVNIREVLLAATGQPA